MTVNGIQAASEKNQSLSDLLLARELDLRFVAVELNGSIVPKSEYTLLMLRDEDTIEIVRFVGGG